ncbi:glutaredoxin [Desulfocucumis palustris]|uniref:Glutaredoxin n=1 Tax=Desulfocucumis palustris TaxID=1898651 RepID=A0A2L2XIZ9_9FIRM|nr:glutaredoxin [Desulfocucumis palustris]
MKEFLSQKGVKYTEQDVAADQRARDEMVQKTGKLAVPVITVGSKVIMGYNPSELEKALH